MGATTSLIFVLNKVGTSTSALNTVSTHDGTVDVTGTIIGIGQTTQSLASLTTVSLKLNAIPKIIPGTGAVLGGFGAYNNARNIQDDLKNNRLVSQGDVAGVVSNISLTVASGVSFAVVCGASIVGAPVIVTTFTVISVGAGIYQFVANANGWTMGNDGTMTPYTLTASDMAQVRATAQQLAADAGIVNTAISNTGAATADGVTTFWVPQLDATGNLSGSSVMTPTSTVDLGNGKTIYSFSNGASLVSNTTVETWHLQSSSGSSIMLELNKSDGAWNSTEYNTQGGIISKTEVKADGSYVDSCYENGKLIKQSGVDSNDVEFERKYTPNGSLISETLITLRPDGSTEMKTTDYGPNGYEKNDATIAVTSADGSITIIERYRGGKSQPYQIEIKQHNPDGTTTTITKNLEPYPHGPGWELLQRLLTSARNLFLTSEAQTSPLILDLDGDGAETTALTSGIQFDHDTNGFAEKTAWVGTDDGLLVRDINGNGTIDSGTELFGNNTILKNGQKASNGFAALADLDENHDGKINASDTAYNQLRVWKDANGDGITDQGELITLADAGVQSITTTYTTSTTVDANGNAHKQTGSFTRADNTTATVDDVWFAMDAMYSTPNQLLAETEEIAALPELQGYGVVYSLHQAMLRDESGSIKSLVEQFAAETDTTKRKDIMNQLLYAWTDSSELSPVRSDYAGYGNGLQIAVLEKLFADSYKNGAGSSGPGAQPLLDQSWNMVFNLYYSQLMAQTHLKPLYSAINYTWDTEAQAIHGDLTPVIVEIQNLLTTDQTAGTTLFEEFTRSLDTLQLTGMLNFSDYKAAFVNQGDAFSSVFEQLAKNNIYGSLGNNYISGTTGDDAIYAYSGNDSLYGGIGNDYLDGGSGNNTIQGEDGDDILVGGDGNDLLTGGNGNDIYKFGVGFGTDTIINSASDYATTIDTIVFTEGLTASDLDLYIDSNSLRINIRGTSDSLTIQNWFSGSTYKIGLFTFSDGTTITAAQMDASTFTAYGTDGGETIFASTSSDLIYGLDGNDYLYGRSGNDYLDGGAGNDTIQGEDGDDTLVGGDGNDLLTGGNGNDIYRFARGSGIDTINNYAADYAATVDTVVFGEGITAADLDLYKMNYDLRINIKGTNDTLTVQGWFNGDSSKIDQFRFADGSTLSSAQMEASTFQVYGTSSYDSLAGSSSNDLMYGLDGNDSLSGGTGSDLLDGGSGNDSLSGEAGNDLLDGGAGNDTLNGGAGNDTYRFGIGSGTDIIANYATDYATTTDTVEFGAGITAANIDLFKDNYNLKINIKGTADTLILQNWFAGNPYKVDQFKFTDNTILTSAQLEGLGYTVVVAPTDRFLGGTAANDILGGGAGNDYLAGNDGADILDGGAGSDTLSGGNGNDTYRFGIGSGTDIIANYATDYATTTDTVEFGAGITANDIDLFKENGNLRINIKGTADTLIIQNWFSGDYYKVDQFKFADNSIMTAAQIDAGGFKLYGAGTDDSLSGSSASDLIYGYNGNDYLYGGAGNDLISGGDGNDNLNGEDGDDTLDGGTANDTLTGGAGNDSYKFGIGSGTDSISNYSADYATAVDIVEFGEGITRSDLELYKEGWNLRIALKNTTDSLVIQSWFVGDSHKVDQFRFADGDTITSVQMDTSILQICGTGGNDILTGSNSADLIYGNNGNDQLDGGIGDDILDGGGGNDSLTGGTGNDTYLFSRGSGTDTINNVPTDYATTLDIVAFGPGISTADLHFIKDGNNLRISVTETSDSLVIQNWFGGNAYKVDQFRFADGSVITAAEVDTKTFNQYGTSGDDALNGSSLNEQILGYEADDTIAGGAGDDILDGGGGNDSLIGGVGNDTYLFGKGSGVDTIRNYSDDYITATDTVAFGAGITANDLDLFKYNGYLYINIKGTTDSLMLEGWFNGNQSKVDQFSFADGTILTAAQVDARGYKVYGTFGNDSLKGSNANDCLKGYEGDDTLLGNDGDDILDGGSGNDTLTGGIGSDTYRFDIGCGIDSIDNNFNDYATTTDVVEFGEGITAADLELYKENSNLKIAVKGTTDTLIILNWFITNSYKVDQFKFSDGSIITASQMDTSTFNVCGTGGVNNLCGSNSSDLMYGFDGNDTLYGRTGNDLLEGGGGNDSLFGEDGDDILDGGTGNDTLNGGGGNDTYLFGIGSGVETIYNNSNDYATTVDLVKFGEGISASDIELYKEIYNLKIAIKGTTDALIIQNWFSSDASYKVDQFKFSDGSIITAPQMDASTFNVFGTGGVDNLYGSNSSDLMYGFDGNDTIIGYAGNDTLTGGSGNDTLTGGIGSDTYRFNIGCGIDSIDNNSSDYATTTDVVEFGEGITAADLELYKENSNLKIAVKGTTDTLIILNWFITNSYKVDQFKFSDGSIITASQMDTSTFNVCGTGGIDSLYGSNSSDLMYGLDGNDTITGYAGNDTLDGGVGNDTLTGGTGNDTYTLGSGYGVDTIVENDTTAGNIDVAQFQSDIATDQLWFQHVGSNLEVSVIGTSDKFTIQSWYSGSQYHVEQFKTADGKTLADSNVEALVSAMASFAAPGAGQTTLPQNYQTALAPVIAANWH